MRDGLRAYLRFVGATRLEWAVRLPGREETFGTAALTASAWYQIPAWGARAPLACASVISLEGDT